MKTSILFALFVSSVLAFGASSSISDMTATTAPSTNTFIEVADMNATPKSRKYLLTNLVTKTEQVNSITTGTLTVGTNVTSYIITTNLTADYGWYIEDTAAYTGKMFAVKHYGYGGAQSYAIDVQNFPSALSPFVIHQYSDESSAFQIDNVGNKAGIEIKNTSNESVRPGVKGTGAFLSLWGYDGETVVQVGLLNRLCQFYSKRTTMPWTFIADAGSTAPSLKALNGNDGGVGLFVQKTGTGNALEVSNGTNTRFTVGQNGETTVSSIALSVTNGSATTLAATNAVYLANVDAQTITLPTAVGIRGRIYTIKTITPAATATIATTSSQLIDGAATYSLTASNKFVHVISDNSNWWVIGNN